MRNLKRALSLALASVMLMGMMVVGTSAASFPDVDDEDNIEAIDVLETVQVMIGDEGTGEFRPDDPVNRAEMAVVMAKLLNLDYNYYVTSCPFTDVSGNYEWAKGWVGACAANGIVSGRGEGIFDPGATVTAVEAASMMMRALGYFQYPGDYQGGFEAATVKQASQISLFSGIGGNANDPLNRNQVAKLALNALESNMVYFSGDVGFELNGVTVGYRSQYTYRTGTEAKYGAIDGLGDAVRLDGTTNLAQGQRYVNLGEQLYDGDLRLVSNTTDAFGRPSRQWEYKGKDIGTYVKKDLIRAEYTTEVTGKTLYDLLTKETVNKYDFIICIDGVQTVADNKAYLGDAYFTEGNLVRTNTKGVGATGNGVLTQVFVDPNEGQNGTVYIAVINTYLAKATNDYDTKREEAKFDVYSLEDKGPSNYIVLVKNTDDKDNDTDKAYTTSLKVKNEEIYVEDVKEDDIFLVHVAEGEIKEILEPEVIADTEISSFKNGSWVNNGTKYDYADSTTYDPAVLDEYAESNMKDTTYNLYLDEYGYLIGIDIVESKTNYVFLTGIDGQTSNLRNKTAEGNVIHLDGTMETVTIKLSDSRYADGEDMTDKDDYHLNSLMNTWCKYTTNKNGDYVLTEIANDVSNFDSKVDKAGQSHVGNTTASATAFANYGTIDKKHVSTQGIANTSVKMAYGTDDSVYLSVSTGLITADRVANNIEGKNPALIIDDVDSVTVGVQNANLKALTASQVLASKTNNGGITDANPAAVAPPTTPATNEPKRLDSIANGVYNLFDKNGAIIAAVVVGEDEGSTTNYAYVISDKMEEEGYSKDDDEWTWSRKVVINGEVTEVQEITDGKDPDIKGMVRGQWYEMKYKADGTVKSAKLIAWDENTNDTKDNAIAVGEFFAQDDDDGNKFVGLIKKVEKSVEANDTVVLAADLTRTKISGVEKTVPVLTDGHRYSIEPDARYAAGIETAGTYKITAEGNTLWVSTNGANIKDGFAVRNDAKVVLVQDTHTIRNGLVTKTNVMENVYEYSQTGKDALSRAVKDLEKNDAFIGFVSAVFDGGVATSVVIWDQTPEDINAGDDPTTPDPDNGDTMEVRVYVTKDGVPDGHIYESWTVTRSTNVAIEAPDVGAQWIPDVGTIAAPAFKKDAIKSVTFNYTPLGTGTLANDGGKAESDDLTAVIDGITPTENDSANAKPTGGVEKNPGTGMTYVSDTVTNSIKTELKKLGAGVYHYTQELQDLLGWCQTTGQISSLQIGPNQNVDTAVFLVTENLASEANGYALYLDNKLVVSGLYKTTTGQQVLTWDEIPVGYHSYRLEKVDDSTIIQAGTFTMTATNAK